MKKTFTKEQLPIIAGEVFEEAQALQSNTATIIALSGELGAGKTTLVQEIARKLGITENVISPTFVIMKTYKIAGILKKFIHIDAYRLTSSEELMKIGWEEIAKDPDNLIIIEWPERVPECVTGKVLRATLSHIDEETRQIEIMI